MSNRRDNGQRIPSPAITRRQIRSHNMRNAFNDDYFLDPRLLGRESSPRGVGRLSLSAPSSAAGTPRSLSRRYANHVDPIDSVSNIVITAPSYIPVHSSRSQESSPRTRVTSAPLHYVNGEASSQSYKDRRKSFPEPPGAYLSEPSPCQVHGQDGKRRDRSPGGGIPRTATGGTNGHHGPGLSVEDQTSISPPSSEEAMSSVTVTMERVGREEGAAGMEVMEGSFTCDDGYTWHSALTCFLCGQLFRRPRILPCGHTFCSDCLVQLKDESLKEGRKLPEGHSACATDTRANKNATDVGAQLVCPMPECRYALRLINLSRWSTRNKTVTEAVSALRRMYENRQDASTQTDICLDSMLVTIPRSLIQHNTSPAGERRGRGLRRNNSSTLVDGMVHRALSMDSLSRHYIPQPHVTWRSYVAMLGMHILHQVIHT